MLKLLGAGILLSGVIGEISYWNKRQYQRIHKMEAFVQFLTHTIYQLQLQKSRVLQLLAQNRMQEDLLRETLELVRGKLQEHCYPDGSEIWSTVFTESKRKWDLKENAWRIVLDTGKGLFGTNLTENVELLQNLDHQMEQLIQEERKQWKEKQKVLTPVGILGGVMLVIILL